MDITRNNVPEAVPQAIGSEPKPHFEILDGMRGVAALGVVIFHFMEWVFSDPGQNFIGHGFLAVDFFFCLSGFVIGYAYDDRIAKMGAKRFFAARLIRLHPLVFLGGVLGLLGFFIDPFAAHSTSYGVGTILLFFLSSVLLIPMPTMEERSYNLFAFNAPSWSLFWEYVANIVYAFVLHRIGRRSLLVLAILAAAGLCFVSYRSGNLLGGWSKSTFWDGGVRIAYSYTAGLLIYRSNWIIKNKLGFIGMAVLLALAFVMPVFKWNWLAEFLVVLLYFPLLVALGAGAKLNSRLQGICRFSGKLSYPLYMTHYAAIWVFGNYLIRQKPGANELVLIITIGTLLLIGFGYLAGRFFDEPIRKCLNDRRQKNVVSK